MCVPSCLLPDGLLVLESILSRCLGKNLKNCGRLHKRFVVEMFFYVAGVCFGIGSLTIGLIFWNGSQGWFWGW
jgi:hypothetical protein